MKDTKIRSWWRFWASAYDHKNFEADLDELNKFYQDE